MKCTLCKDALHSHDQTVHDFITLVDRGSLVWPSESVVKVCVSTEKVMVGLLKLSKKAHPKGDRVHQTVATSVLENTADMNLFETLQAHQFDAPSR